MKLLISLTDQSFFATKSVGIYNVTMGLVKGFMQCEEIHELHLLGNNECAPALGALPPHVHTHLMNKKVPRRFNRVWWDQIGCGSAIRAIRPDWALLPKGFPPYFPFTGGAKLACYLHDVNWEYYEKLSSQKVDSPFPRHQLAYFRTLGLRSLRVSDLVLTSTQFNKNRYASYVPQARTAVVGIGFDDPPADTPAQGRDILFFASPYPHKLTRLGISRLTAWLRQAEGGNAIRIHIIGRLPQGVRPPDERWISHGRLPQAELSELMRSACKVSVYFSDYEGFGMPPVESLRAGLPCAASDLPPIRENIPPEYLFSNDSEQSFIDTMNRLYTHTGDIPVPRYPTWKEVAQRCVSAMKNAD